jgi:hypothetical protein
MGITAVMSRYTSIAGYPAVALAAASALGWAAPAAALISPVGLPATVASAEGAPTQLAIHVTATVQPQCGFAPGFEPQSPPTIEANGGPIAAVRIPFRLACNDEFTIQVTSANGGLRSEASPATLARANASGFRTEAPYTLRLDIVRDEGGDLSETCTSQQLMTGAGCQMASSGQVSEFPSTAGESAMTIEFPEAVEPRGYVAGRYQDVLTVTVATRT